MTNLNVCYLHVVYLYALYFAFMFMLADKFFTLLHPCLMCLDGMVHDLLLMIKACFMFHSLI
jgi:hypothetical protein